MRPGTTIFLLMLLGCSPQTEPPQVLRLATTSSTRDSGLLNELLPKFEQKFHCRVDVVAVGTGAALKLGESGDADVLLVHAPESEEDFMNRGHGTRREELMYNEFVILGPKTDPAKVRGDSPLDALNRIATGKHKFISRGDDSGTHQRENKLWRKAGGKPKWAQYLESGQGMAQSLIMADEQQAYILADRGTYLNFREKVDLVPLVSSSPLLQNYYSVIAVNPNKNKRLNAPLANTFIEYLLSADAQLAIGAYRVGNQPLFHPTRLPE